MSSPEVTIILRATRRDSLPRAIDSALRQTFTDHEVLVVDDACDLADVVGAFPDRRVRYHRNAERLGEAASLRTGVELARGSLVSCLDDDDLLLPAFLERAVEQFHADPSLGVVFSNQYYERHGRLWPRETGLEGGRHDRILPALVRNYPIGASVNVIRRQVWLDGERVLPVSPDAPSDIVYGIRTAMAGWPFYYIDEPLGVYRLHPGQMSARLGVRERGVNLWSGFRFPDSELEWIRLGRVAEGHIACAALSTTS